MRTSIIVCAFLVVVGTIAGCANGSGTPTDGGLDVRIMIPDTGGGTPDVPLDTSPLMFPDVPSTLPDVPPRPDTGGGVICSTIACSTAADCSACMPGAGRSACCDTSVGRCFQTTAPMCPAAAPDTGMSMY